MKTAIEKRFQHLKDRASLTYVENQEYEALAKEVYNINRLYRAVSKITISKSNPHQESRSIMNQCRHALILQGN